MWRTTAICAVVCLLAVMAASAACVDSAPAADKPVVVASAVGVAAASPVAVAHASPVHASDLSPAPESGSWFAFGTGGVGLIAYVRRRMATRRHFI